MLSQVKTRLHRIVTQKIHRKLSKKWYRKPNNMGDRGAMTGEWLANCQACSVPKFSSVFNRAHVKYDIIIHSLCTITKIFVFLRKNLKDWLVFSTFCYCICKPKQAYRTSLLICNIKSLSLYIILHNS